MVLFYTKEVTSEIHGISWILSLSYLGKNLKFLFQNILPPTWFSKTKQHFLKSITLFIPISFSLMSSTEEIYLEQTVLFIVWLVIFQNSTKWLKIISNQGKNHLRKVKKI